MRDAVAIWAALVLTYMVFAGAVNVSESVAAVGCASLGTLWWWGVGRRGGTRFHFDRGTLRPLGPAILAVPRQAVHVGLRLSRVVLGRAGGGTTRERTASELSWAAASGDTVYAARAVGLFAASLTPDSYVLILDREHGTVATHALEDDAP